MPILLFLTVVLSLARRTDQMIRERVMGVKKKNTIQKVEFPESSAKKKKSDKQLMTDKFTERKAYRFKQSKRIFKMEIRAL